MSQINLNHNIYLNFVLRLIFPFTHLIVNFTLSFLLLIVGLKGEINLVSELAILQSINFMIFFPFNGNARNYILNSADQNFNENIFNFRLLSYFPLFIISLLTGLLLIDIEPQTIFFLLLLVSTSWFLDLSITICEKQKNYLPVIFLCISLLIALLLVSLCEISNTNINLFCIGLLIIYIPMIIYFLIKYYKPINISNLRTIFKDKILTQIGGTAVIGISSFALKNIILLLLLKPIAGIIFMGFTLGGAVASIYAYSLGPTFIFNFDIRKINNKRVMLFLLLLLLSFGIIIFFLSLKSISDYKHLFISCLIASSIGATLLVFSQSLKLFVTYRDLTLNIFKFEFIINSITIILVSILILFFNGYGAIFAYPLTSITSLYIYRKIYKKDQYQS